MKLEGNITQIKSDYGNVTMNIVGVQGGGHIGVEFSIYQRPTYLLRYGNSSIVRLMVFDSPEWADEWFETYGDIYKDVERLDKEDTSVASNDSPEE